MFFGVTLGDDIPGLGICLGAVGLIGNADDIAALAEQADLLGKFLNRDQVNASAPYIDQLFKQLPAIGDAYRIFIHKVFLGVLEIIGELLVQVVSVGQQDDGGLMQLRGRGDPLCKESMVYDCRIRSRPSKCRPSRCRFRIP